MRFSLCCVLALLINGSVAAGEDPGRGNAPENSSEAAVLPATVLLVTSPELAEAWGPFALWKTQTGRSTKIMTTAEIDAQYPGVDLPARIKACVLAHMAEAGTRWVILGGDSQPGTAGHVPDRDTPHRLYGGAQRYGDIPTDLYYVTAGSWDANGDGVYGDWRQDRAAMSYDSLAAIGRIPVRDVGDVEAYTAKVVGYESRYPSQDFARKLLYTCAVPQANYKSDMLWEGQLGTRWDGELLEYFVDRTPWDGSRRGDYALSPENWAARLNARTAGKMHMHGHGLLNGWVLERNRMVTAKTVAGLSHEDAYLVITTVSCFTGQFDAAEDASIAESMLRQPKGGAVAIVAPSRPGVPIFAGWSRDPRDGVTQDGTTGFLTRFWDHGLNSDLTAGEALAQARRDYAERAQNDEGFHWIECELNLLGDPTLDLRARDPQTPSLSASGSLRVGRSGALSVTTTPGATVCAWKQGEVYEVAKADEDGHATLSVRPRSKGQVRVSVSGPSLNVASLDVEVKSLYYYK